MVENDDHGQFWTCPSVKPESALSRPMGGSGPPPNTWFLGPPQVYTPNGIDSAAVAGLTLTTIQGGAE